MKFKLLGGLAAAALLATAVSAHAGEVNITFTPFDLSQTDSFLAATLFYSDTANLDGSFDITNITGTIGANTITSLVAGGPALTLSTDGAYDFDNLLLTPDGFDNNGPLFMDSAGGEDNLYLRVASPQTYNLVQKPLNYSGGVDGSLAFSKATGGVPEPASWALMILGFGGVGATIRNRRKTATAVLA